MHAVSDTAAEDGPIQTRSRSFARAFDDLIMAFGQRELWLHLGWQDIKQRYRRSLIGPFWITISMGATVGALGLLYSTLLGQPTEVLLPYLAVGFLVWIFMSGCIQEGGDTFISNEGLIKQLPAPVSVYIFRTVWRQFLLMGHNAIIYFVVLAVFRMPIHITVLTVIPALLLLALNGAWAAMLFGIVSARFRDVPPVLGTIIQLMFFMTPIVWTADIVTERGQAWRARIVEWNPFYHFIEIVRDPLIGADQTADHWIWVLCITVIGWALALVFLRQFRARVAYWV